MHKSLAKMKLLRDGHNQDPPLHLPSISSSAEKAGSTTPKFAVSEAGNSKQEEMIENLSSEGNTRPRRHSFQVTSLSSNGYSLGGSNLLTTTSSGSGSQNPPRRRSSSIFGNSLPSHDATPTDLSVGSTKYRKKVEFDKDLATKRRQKRLELMRKQQEAMGNVGKNVSEGDSLAVNNKAAGNTSSNDDDTASMERALEETEFRALESRNALMKDLNTWVGKFVVKMEDNKTLSQDGSEVNFDGMQDDASLDYSSDRHSDLFSHRVNNNLTPIRTTRKHTGGGSASTTHSLSSRTPFTPNGSIPGTPHDDVHSTRSVNGRRQSTAADILKPDVMTLSHGGIDDFDDTDPSNCMARAMKKAWDSINEFESVLSEEVLGTIDVSDLIDDFMASNLINFSLKLRNLFYKIEEVDDINSRRTREERKILLKVLDLADEEERFRAKQYLDKMREQDERDSETTSQHSGNTQAANEPPVLSIEEISQRAQQRKQRRARSIWANEDRQAQLLEDQPHHVETMTNIDFTFIEHLQKEQHRLSKRCHHLSFMMEDMASNFPRQLDQCKQETKAAFEKLYVKDTDEFGMQFDTEVAPTERVIVKQAKDESLQDFASNMNAVFDSMNTNEDMPPEMKNQVKNLMGLVMTDNKLQQEQKKLDKAEKKAKSSAKKGAKKKKTSSLEKSAGDETSDVEEGDADHTDHRGESAETPRGAADDTSSIDAKSRPASSSSTRAKTQQQSAGTATRADIEKQYSLEQIQNSTSDVNITRRVSVSPRPDMNSNVRIERWQEDEKQHIKSMRKASPAPRPPPIVHSAAASESTRRRYSEAPSEVPFKKTPLPSTRIMEFDISDAPEKWQQRREDLVRQRYENMKRILQCFYTIVYEGTMHGYFKTLWDDDDESDRMRNGLAMRATPKMISSHHFNPQYTGKGGFEYLMNVANQKVAKKIKKQQPPSRTEVISETPDEFLGSTSRRPSTTATGTRGEGTKVAMVRSVSQSSKRSFTVPSPSPSPRENHSSKSARLSRSQKTSGVSPAPSADMSQMFSDSRSSLARGAGHRLLRR